MGYGKAVSIHAPHEGERPFTGVQKTVDATVSIHAPHEGERLYFPTFFSTASKFQSTLPTRGSDLRGWRYMLLLVRFQSTLPTRGSDHEFLEQSDAEWVSIHAPHEGERRLSSLRVASYLSCFNPRSPRGGATLFSGASSSQTMVSIHAPHEGERRMKLSTWKLRRMCFNPRSPRGGATYYYLNAIFFFESFNPRSPRGGATAEKCICMQHFREFTEYYPLRHGDACCIAPQDCIIQAFFGAKKRCFYVRLCFALKNKGVRG